MDAQGLMIDVVFDPSLRLGQVISYRYSVSGLQP